MSYCLPEFDFSGVVTSLTSPTNELPPPIASAVPNLADYDSKMPAFCGILSEYGIVARLPITTKGLFVYVSTDIDARGQYMNYTTIPLQSITGYFSTPENMRLIHVYLDQVNRFNFPILDSTHRRSFGYIVNSYIMNPTTFVYVPPTVVYGVFTTTYIDFSVFFNKYKSLYPPESIGINADDCDY